MSPSSNTFLLPTGGFSRCWCSSIQLWKLKACSRPVAMARVLRIRHAGRRRARPRRSLSPQVSNARRVASFSASVSSSIGRRTAPPAWPSSSCQYFECAWNFSAGRVRAERLAHRIEAVADRAWRARPRRQRKVGVVAHAPVGLGLVQVGRRRAEIELPAELDDVVEPFLFRRRAHDHLVAREPRQPRIHLARHAVLDRDHVGQLGDARAQLRAHQIAASRDGSRARCRYPPAR